jgi:uncharacterized membrane protein YeaQ/YmgE (transglycosylase-associated protein family)
MRKRPGLFVFSRLPEFGQTLTVFPMKDIKPFAIIVGLVVDVGSTQVLLTRSLLLLTICFHLSAQDLQALAKDHSPTGLLSAIIPGALGSCIGGFVAGRLATTAEIKNTILMGLLSSLSGFLISGRLPLWYYVCGTLVTIGAATTGGYVARVIASESR